MTDDEGRDAARSVLVVCSDRSHPHRQVKIATYEAVIDTAGHRLNTELIRHKRTTAAGTSFTTSPVRVARLGPGGGWRPIWRHHAIESAVNAEGFHWHLQLSCPLCGINVAARHDRVGDVVGRLLDNGVSQIELADLGRILK